MVAAWKRGIAFDEALNEVSISLHRGLCAATNRGALELALTHIHLSAWYPRSFCASRRFIGLLMILGRSYWAAMVKIISCRSWRRSPLILIVGRVCAKKVVNVISDLFPGATVFISNSVLVVFRIILEIFVSFVVNEHFVADLVDFQMSCILASDCE